jgi:two-component system, OmpR family, sensor histidine kinase BaeS
VSRGRRRPRAVGLAPRLLAAQVLVALTGALTAWLVALLVGPALFHEHLQRASAAHPGDQTRHAEEAFASATAISLSVALLAAVVAALMASWYATRRIGRPLSLVAKAAADIASGRYEARVQPPGLGEEFDAMARSFNEMAGQLSSVEGTRRRLLGDLAHEMRTPLATIDGYLEGIEDGVAVADEATLAMLRTQTHRLTRLAEDVGAVSRAEEGRLPLSRQRLDPMHVVDSAVAAASTGFEAKGVSLHVSKGAHVPLIDADPDRLGQVLANLLDNALRLTAPGGRVDVGVSATDDGAAIEVRDTGAGISPEHLSHVFERFYRVDTARDRTHGGSGIGLTISKALIEAHGGRIAVESGGPGRGATFRVWLPRASD